MTLLVSAGGAVLLSNALVLWRARHRISSRIVDVPPVDTALVLGCAPWLRTGQNNFYFDARISAALDLFHSKAIARLIVSGAPLGEQRRKRGVPTECHAMRDALIGGGVPAENIVMDIGGLRTRLSLERARDHFGVKRLVVVSQAFHTPRAVYLGQTSGLETYAYNAPSPPFPSMTHVRLVAREWAARTRAAFGL